MKALPSKKVYSLNCKRVLAIWLRYLTVKISDVPCTGDDVSLFVKETGSSLTITKCFDNVNFSGKNFKFSMLTKFYPYIRSHPLTSGLFDSYFGVTIILILPFFSLFEHTKVVKSRSDLPKDNFTQFQSPSGYLILEYPF